MNIPEPAIFIFAFIGIASIAYFLPRLTVYLFSWLKNKTPPKTLIEEKNHLLQSELDRLNQKISQLEKENEDMTRAVIQQLR